MPPGLIRPERGFRSAMRESGRTKTILVVFSFLLASILATGGIIEDTCPVTTRFFPLNRPGFKDPRTFADTAYRTAVTYFNAHLSQIRNRRFLTIIDYTKPSFTRRLYLIDLDSYRVERYYVAHGKNSGYVYANRFSNDIDSYMSSRGFFLTGREFYGSHGVCLVLHGLEKGVNDKAMERGIVLHGAEYITPAAILLNGGRLGRSLGCPAVSMEAIDKIVGKIKRGSLLYIHTAS